MKFWPILFLSFFLSYELFAAPLGYSPSKNSQAQVLINGRPAQAGELPGIVQIFMGGGSCTGQIVESNVLLTAAHCIDDSKTISFNFGGKSITGACEAGNQNTLDIAACVLSEPISTKYLSVANATVDGPVMKDQQMIAAGMGCVNPDGSGGNDGVLRVGFVEVDKLKSMNNSSVFFETKGGAGLCPGDSGGAHLKSASDLFKQKHVLYGINSRVYLKNKKFIPQNILVNLTSQPAQDFLKNFATSKNLKICGINETCNNGDEPQSTPTECGNNLADQLKATLEAYKQCVK